MKCPAPCRNDQSRSVRRAERRLGNAALLTHDGYGHLSHSDPSACVMQALGSYLVDLTTSPRGTTCPSDHLPFEPASASRPHLDD